MFMLTGNDIVCNHDNDKKKMYAFCLREYQQKRLMNTPVVKKLKAKCKLGPKNFVCPMCKEHGHESLTAAHVGIKIKDQINCIVERYIDQKDYFELCHMVIDAEKNSQIMISCRACNKKLEKEIVG